MGGIVEHGGGREQIKACERMDTQVLLLARFSETPNFPVQEKNYFAEQIPPQGSKNSEEQDQWQVVAPC
jgi:hypothetical protein